MYVLVFRRIKMHYIEIFYILLIIKFKLKLHLLMITSILILLVLVTFPITFEVKIKRFWVAYLGAISYVIFYILIFLSIRILYFNKHADLKPYYKFIDIFIDTPIYYKSFLLLIVFNIILIWIYLFVKIKKILLWQIWQLHIYWDNIHPSVIFKEMHLEYFIENNFWIKRVKVSQKYSDMIGKLRLTYSIRGFSYYIIYKPIINVIRKFTKKSYNYYFYPEYYTKTLKYLVLIGLIGVFLYEIIYNNWVLHYTIHYLLFYMIFSLWYRLSWFLLHGQNSLTIFIFERAYCEPDLYYVNLTTKEEKLVEAFIKNPYDTKSYDRNLPFSISSSVHSLEPLLADRRFYKTKTIHHESWFEKDHILKTKEYIWCNHSRDPYFMFWFNQKDLITINKKHFVKENKENNEHKLMK